MRSHLSALALLLYWQAGPLPRLEHTDTGKTRWSLSLMGGKGRWEDPSFNCAGDVIGVEQVTARNVGGKLDLESGKFHISAGASRLSLSRYSGDVSSSVALFGAQVAHEGTKVGTGFGVTRSWWSGDRSGPVGSFYVRLGRATKAHFRMDVNPITELPGLVGSTRFGIGFPAGFIGFTLDPYAQDGGGFYGTNLLADLVVPVHRNVDMRLVARGGTGNQQGQYGVGAGIRVHSPKR